MIACAQRKQRRRTQRETIDPAAAKAKQVKAERLSTQALVDLRV